ncbi:MAG: hypothetical protein JO137_20315 [Hyphomicrobiales bacterium]|nr:hypothetical protein [Hyphomicrobiales bacterium]
MMFWKWTGVIILFVCGLLFVAQMITESDNAKNQQASLCGDEQVLRLVLEDVNRSRTMQQLQDTAHLDNLFLELKHDAIYAIQDHSVDNSITSCVAKFRLPVPTTAGGDRFIKLVDTHIAYKIEDDLNGKQIVTVTGFNDAN